MVSLALHITKPPGLGVRPLQRVDDQRQRINKLLTPLECQRLKYALVSAPHLRGVRAQDAVAFVGEPDGVGAGVLLCAASLQQALPLHAAHDVGHRGAVDAGAINKAGLAETFVLRDRDENGELTRGQVVGPSALNNISAH